MFITGGEIFMQDSKDDKIKIDVYAKYNAFKPLNNPLKKFPCPECYNCLFCADSRCLVCRKSVKTEENEKDEKDPVENKPQAPEDK